MEEEKESKIDAAINVEMKSKITNSKAKSTCFIPDCRSDNPEFAVPKDPFYKGLWEDVIEKYGLTLKGKLKICEKHFSQNDIIRDLKGELLGLPIKRKLKPEAVPHLNLFTIKQENFPTIKKSKSGRRLVKKPVSFDSETELKEDKNSKSKNPNNESSNISKQKKIISKEKKPPLTNSISSISQRIQDLKTELLKLREERLQSSKKYSEEEISQNEISESVDSSGENSNSKMVTAEEIRVRYKEALGMKIKGVEKSQSKKPKSEEITSIPENKKDSLFYVSMSPSVLLGSPELTAEYFVKQVLDEKNLQYLPCPSSSELKEQFHEKLNDEKLPNGIMLFDKQAHHLWKINSNMVHEEKKSLKKIHDNLLNDSNIVRPRERFMSERKYQWLEPQLNKLKHTYEELRKYRRQELSKSATLKMARLKRNNRRKKRREWIHDQIKKGKLHKSALIWVNSNKLLPFERTEKQIKTTSTNDAFSIDISEDDDQSGDEINTNVEQIELNEAVKSIKSE